MALLPDLIKRLTGLPKGTVVNPLQQELINRVAGGGDISSQFGPGIPPEAQPLDASGLPRSQFFRVGWNLQANPDTDRGVNFATLRTMADLDYLARKAIEIRKDEICSLSWDVRPKTGTTAEQRAMMKKARPKIDKLREFWESPDKDLDYQTWMRQCIEDVLVIDALSIYKRPTKNGKLHSLMQIDGSLVRPLINLQGRRPEPPAIAYEQVIIGVNRYEFTRDELLYLPKTRRVWTPYGFSPIEQFLTLINLALRHRSWVTAIFTDGNIPQALLSAPENYSIDQINDLMTLRDQIRAGDPRYARVMEMMPHGVETIIQNGGEAYLQFGSEIANWIIDLTCVCLDITRQELGLAPSNTEGLGGSGHAQAQEGVHFRRSLLPLANWLADVLFTPLLKEFGLGEFRWIWPDLSEEDAATKASMLKDKFLSAQISHDDMLLELGLDPGGTGYFLQMGGSLFGVKDLAAIDKMGWQAYNAQAEQGKAEHEHGLEKDMETHKAGLQQQQTEHQAQVEADSQDQQVDLEHEKQQAHVESQEQIAEHAHHLMIRDAAFRHQMSLEQASHQHELGIDEATHQHGLAIDQAEHGADLQSDQTDQQAGIAGDQQDQQHALTLAQQAHQSGLQTAQQADQLAQQHGYSLDQATHQAGLAGQAADQKHEQTLDQAEHGAGLQGQQAATQQGYALQSASHQAGLQGQQAATQQGYALQSASHQAGLQGANQQTQLATQHGHRMEEQGRQFVYGSRQADQQHGHQLEQGALQHERAKEMAKLAPKKPNSSKKVAMPSTIDRFLAKRGYKVEVDPAIALRGTEHVSGTLSWAEKSIRVYADADPDDVIALAGQALCLELDSLAYRPAWCDLSIKYCGAETDPEAFFGDALKHYAADPTRMPSDVLAYFRSLDQELERLCA